MSEDKVRWHPLCLSLSVEKSSSAGVKLLGKELVVWRDEAGKAHVWEDRCPHRGMKLSLGFVRGDHLACLYHGWQYNADGRCRFIPAHPDLDVPATITVPVYGVREWAGIVWAALESDANTEETAENFEATPVRSIYLELPLEEAASALSTIGLGDGTVVKRLESNLCLIKAGDEQLIAAFQPIGDVRTALHLVICGTSSPDRQRHYALALEALRHAIETGAKANV
jgi:nitrite reductase/ring-hydroxylating ferredoxin subunit